MNTTEIFVRHCTDRHNQPLLVLAGLPWGLRGEGAELYPAMARAYARALLQAADDCERSHADSETSGRVRIGRSNAHKTYLLESVQVQAVPKGGVATPTRSMLPLA